MTTDIINLTINHFKFDSIIDHNGIGHKDFINGPIFLVIMLYQLLELEQTAKKKLYPRNCAMFFNTGVHHMSPRRN